MKYSLSLAALAASSMVTASPVAKRQAALTDVDILNYALTLEHLEDKFYRDGLKNYTKEAFAAAGFDETFYKNLKEVSYDETTHVSFLSKALGDKAVPECTYAFPSTDPASFVAVASVLEGVGVSAYLGAAAYITNPDYLTAAGSILTVEARHSSYIRASLDQSPFPSPFDAPLSFNEVYTLAASFIVSCPPGPPGPALKAFPTLALGTTGTVTTGTTITLLTPGYALQAKNGATVPIYAAFITVTGPIYVLATPVAGGFTVQVPAGVAGQTYVVLTGCQDAVNDNTIVAGPAIVEITL